MSRPVSPAGWENQVLAVTKDKTKVNLSGWENVPKIPEYLLQVLPEGLVLIQRRFFCWRHQEFGHIQSGLRRGLQGRHDRRGGGLQSCRAVLDRHVLDHGSKGLRRQRLHIYSLQKRFHKSCLILRYI